jgi:nitrite reductase (NADH) small subunit/3-phenylpropionate/trans-cinnamate dioxygenase ferredoxin subunit
MAWVSLCTLDELTDGQGKYVEIDGYRLAVFLTGEQVTAIDSTCPHAGANLADGWIEDGCAVCPWHAWAFRLDNGQMRDTPGVAVTRYPTRIHPHAGKQFVQAELPVF